MESTAPWHKFRGLLLWSWQQIPVVLIKNKIGCWDSLFPETTIRSAWGCPQQKEPLFWLVIFVSDRDKAGKLSITQTSFFVGAPNPQCQYAPIHLAPSKTPRWNIILGAAVFSMKYKGSYIQMCFTAMKYYFGASERIQLRGLHLSKVQPSSGSARGEGSVVTAWVELLISCPKR